MESELKLEAGQYVRLRNGETRGPLAVNGTNPLFPWCSAELSWQSNGCYKPSGARCSFDIVAVLSSIEALRHRAAAVAREHTEARERGEPSNKPLVSPFFNAEAVRTAAREAGAAMERIANTMRDAAAFNVACAPKMVLLVSKDEAKMRAALEQIAAEIEAYNSDTCSPLSPALTDVEAQRLARRTLDEIDQGIRLSENAEGGQSDFGFPVAKKSTKSGHCR